MRMNLNKEDKTELLNLEIPINHRLATWVGVNQSNNIIDSNVRHKFLQRVMYIDFMTTNNNNSYIVLNVNDEAGNFVEHDFEISEETYSSLLIMRRTNKIKRLTEAI